MRIAFFALAVSALIVLAMPSYADEAKDYIDNEVAEWTRIANADGYNILDTIVDTIGADPLTYTFELGPGKYHLYASGGMNITDIDTTATGPEDKELDSDSSPDKIPILVFKITEPTAVTVTLAQFSETEEYVDDYFCLLITAEGEGEIISATTSSSAMTP
jgi:hypothetical protein